MVKRQTKAAVVEKLQEQTEKLTMQQAMQQLKLVEDQLNLYDQLVDMSDISRFGDESIGGTSPVDAMINWGLVYPGAIAIAMRNETERRQIVARSRVFGMTNPYAIGAQQNRINYTVGQGHVYKVSQVDPDADDGVDEETLKTVRNIIDDFCCENHWRKRQAETVRRLDRDGERFLRFFPDREKGMLRVRFVEPLQVQTPGDHAGDRWTYFGVKFKEGDSETPEVFYVNEVDEKGLPTGKFDSVPAEEMQHLKANVDMNAPRGLPTWWALETHLKGAVRTLSNMGKLVEFRTRIGMIRKHVNAAQSTIQAYVASQSSLTGKNADGSTRTIMQYPQAAILDTSDQTGYEFPSHNTDVETIVAGIQAELRAAAAALAMPEYMISGDASNANFSSTMVAEGPAVKGFEAMQADLIEADLEVIRLAVETAIEAEGLPDDILDLIKIEAEPPIIKSENRLQETQADQLLVQAGAMSLDTMAARAGLEFEDEQAKIEEESNNKLGYGDDGMVPPGVVSWSSSGMPGTPSQVSTSSGMPGTPSQVSTSSGVTRYDSSSGA